MFQKRRESIEAQRRMVEQPAEQSEPRRTVTDMEIFQLPGASYRVVTVPKSELS